MIPQLSQIDAKELYDSRLSTENINSKNSDSSFEQKLKEEKERLGLMFSPFSHLNAFFSSLSDFSFESNDTHNDPLAFTKKELLPSQEVKKTSAKEPQRSESDGSLKVQIFESSPFKTYFNRQMLQKLLATTNWLVPNLQSTPLFFQASLQGTLQPKLDLQALVDEIIKQVKLVKSEGQINFSLTLTPPELGEIFLTLISRSGILSIEIQASPETKKLINDQKHELELSLKKAHINVSQIQIEEVTKNA